MNSIIGVFYSPKHVPINHSILFIFYIILFFNFPPPFCFQLLFCFIMQNSITFFYFLSKTIIIYLLVFLEGGRVAFFISPLPWLQIKNWYIYNPFQIFSDKAEWSVSIIVDFYMLTTCVIFFFDYDIIWCSWFLFI